MNFVAKKAVTCVEIVHLYGTCQASLKELKTAVRSNDNAVGPITRC